MKKRGRRIAKKLVGVLLASAIMLQSVGCGSEMLGVTSRDMGNG